MSFLFVGIIMGDKFWFVEVKRCKKAPIAKRNGNIFYKIQVLKCSSFKVEKPRGLFRTYIPFCSVPTAPFDVPKQLPQYQESFWAYIFAALLCSNARQCTKHQLCFCLALLPKYHTENCINQKQNKIIAFSRRKVEVIRGIARATTKKKVNFNCFWRLKTPR